MASASVDGPHQILDRGLEFHGGDRLGDQFRGLRADDVDTQKFAALRVGDDLDEAPARMAAVYPAGPNNDIDPNS